MIRRLLFPVSLAAAVLSACGALSLAGGSGSHTGPAAHPAAGQISLSALNLRSGPSRLATAAGATKINHLVIITQENRSFDSMFGTFPGAFGIHSQRRICVRDGRGHCLRPYHTRTDISPGGPHGYHESPIDIDGGRMDGFIKAEIHHQKCGGPENPCPYVRNKRVLAYNDGHELVNYWRYARRFSLADHFFESVGNWSFPSHLYEVSGWAAQCADTDPSSCSPTLDYTQERHGQNKMILAWTDITYLLHAYGVSWRYYVEPGLRPDCQNDQGYCAPETQTVQNGSIWNPLPQFETVQEDKQVGNVQSVSRYVSAARSGNLPSVSWIVPSQKDSEHAPARESDGQAFVTKMVDAAMNGPQWRHTAILVNWDDWGGLYDNAAPPKVDNFGYGVRVPLIIISPYARAGHVFHQNLSSDAFLKFIEDRWLRGQRLDPSTDGRPDPRPDVRENAPQLGNLMDAFNFRQRPIRPFYLPSRPRSMDFTEASGYPPATRACTGKCKAAVANPLVALQALARSDSSR